MLISEHAAKVEEGVINDFTCKGVTVSSIAALAGGAGTGALLKAAGATLTAAGGYGAVAAGLIFGAGTMCTLFCTPKVRIDKIPVLPSTNDESTPIMHVSPYG